MIMVDQMTHLIVGSIYQDGAEGRRTPAPESPTRTALLAKIAAARIAAWDSEQENALDALLAVLDWHRPSQIWKQIFKPTYIGDRYLGVGCRSCNWRAASDCPTVRAIATAFTDHTTEDRVQFINILGEILNQRRGYRLRALADTLDLLISYDLEQPR